MEAGRVFYEMELRDRQRGLFRLVDERVYCKSVC